MPLHSLPLIPLSIVMVAAIGVVFWWAVVSGQFDDLEGPAHRVLMDDDQPPRGSDEQTSTGDRRAPR